MVSATRRLAAVRAKVSNPASEKIWRGDEAPIAIGGRLHHQGHLPHQENVCLVITILSGQKVTSSLCWSVSADHREKSGLGDTP